MDTFLGNDEKKLLLHIDIDFEGTKGNKLRSMKSEHQRQIRKGIRIWNSCNKKSLMMPLYVFYKVS